MLPQSWLLGVVTTIIVSSNVAQAKIYDRCELARELHDRFKFSKRDLDKWLCLAYWESRFDTRAYHKGRYDGSGDHGIFQINDKYWCQPYSGYSENVCKVPCYMLRDDNLEDDIQCVNKIFRRHGFHAWMVFTHKCSGNTLEFFNGCDIKSRKGPLPRYEAQASTISAKYARPLNHTDDMEPSASSHEASHTSAEESIHNVGGDFSSARQRQPTQATYSYSAASPAVQSSLFRQASVPATIHIQPPMGGVSLVAPTLGSENLFLGAAQSLSPQTSFGRSALPGHSQHANPLAFSSTDLSLFSAHLTPQASQLTPMVEAPKPSKPGVIKRLQGALSPFRLVSQGPFKTLGRSVVAAGSKPVPMRVIPPAPMIPGYGAPILLPVNQAKSFRPPLDKRKQTLTTTTTKAPVDPLIAALSAPFPSSTKRKPKESEEEDDEDEDDRKKRKKR